MLEILFYLLLMALMIIFPIAIGIWGIILLVKKLRHPDPPEDEQTFYKEHVFTSKWDDDDD